MRGAQRKYQKPWKAEYARTARSHCRTCKQLIGQDLLRFGLYVEPDRFVGVKLDWHHADCLFKKEGQIKSIGDIEAFELLRWDDQKKIKSYIYPTATQKPDGGRRPFFQLSCLPRDWFDYECLRFLFPSRARRAYRKKMAASFLAAQEATLEEQNKAVWHIKDELQKHVKVSELRKMLKANNQYPRGSAYDLREHCADGMVFGALESCPVCNCYSLRYVGGRYDCHGFVSEFSQCLYSLRAPARLEEKWRLPPDTKNQYLLEWFESQAEKKPIRLIVPTSEVPGVDDDDDDESLENLKVTIAGESTMDEIGDLKQKLKASGVKFYTNIKKDTSCLVWLGEMDDNNSVVKSARRLRIPVVRSKYLKDCLQQEKKLPFHPYTFETPSPYSKMVPVTVREHVVNAASGLQGTGHILKDGEDIYDLSLNKSDFAAGVNSFYILQIIQEGEDPNCYLFRKWGPIGNETVGDSMLEKMPMSQAIELFKRLFQRQTGNPWESWNPNDDNFEKRPGKYHPVNIDYEVEYVPPLKLEESSSSKLPPQVKELMETICNEQIYRAHDMETFMNMDDLPLGKLSEVRIAKGLKILDQISDLLPRCADQAIKRKIMDFSNNFYHVIPSIHTYPILDIRDWSAKKRMLDNLMETEEKMRELGISTGVDASVEENYKKLRCEMKPLPPDNNDYKLVEKYFLSTRNPLHKEWSLKLEEIFEINREDDEEIYASYGVTLHNKMLLWHGSEWKNILGILSQGLTIAPRAASAAGYKRFGKGLYFSDLASKGAEHCFVKEGPGIIFLAEVALGDSYELTKNQQIEELPQGKHSVKGVGRVNPLEKGSVVWRDQVTVPCGKPTPSLNKSQLESNEYVVYNPAQVNLRFLVKVKLEPSEEIVGPKLTHSFWFNTRNLFGQVLDVVRHVSSILVNSS